MWGYVALWIVVAAEGAMISLGVVRQLRSEVRAERRAKGATLEDLIGDRLPVLTVQEFVDVESKARSVRSSVCAGSVVFFVTPKCVASHRLIKTLADGMRCVDPEVDFVFAFIGPKDSSSRLVDLHELRLRSVMVGAESFAERYSALLPFAVSVGRNEIVIHAGKVDTLAGLEKFIEASGLIGARDWFSSLNGRGRVKRGLG